MDFDVFNMDLDDFYIWYGDHLKEFKNKIPNFDHVVYFELVSKNVGIQISETVFKEFLLVFKRIDGFNYSFDRTNDCTVYYINNCPVLRLYKWGCFS